MLRFLGLRPRPSRSLSVVSTTDAGAAAVQATRLGACPLASCATGARATVLELCCGHAEACRLRALGFSEGTQVDVVDARHAMLLDVRGTRIALGRALTAGITVQPIAG